ncbi:unnamed protein product [Eruca vesicaria subsp. sativa]|uniref:Uncharacterized protein n=1 Tax=Eruca vesicaria subsp. sativa TaxID=29727 RepID=A0ABC8K1Y3_ERUVS|nr:unnamed protein product [Eruca vesicaria subsp. sativa]
MESSATVSLGSLLPPKPPDPDLDMVFPTDPPVPPVPPDPPPIILVRASLYQIPSYAVPFRQKLSIPSEPPDLDSLSSNSGSRGCDVVLLFSSVSSSGYGCLAFRPFPQIFTQISTLKYPSKMVTKNDGDGCLRVSASDTSFAFRLLFPMICRSLFGCANWPTTPPLCSSSTGFFLDVGVVFVYLFSWWQVEEKLIVIFIPKNMDVAGYDFLLVPCLNQSPLLIFPPIWSKLDVQVSLVLQGFSSLRMLFSAYGALCVVLQVILDAVFEETYNVVVIRFHIVPFCDLYRHSISYVIVVSVCLAVNSPLCYCCF